MKRKIKVAIVGTNGIPAKYGGYETLAEYLTEYLSKDFDYTVYCSKTQPKVSSKHNDSQLVYIPLKANGWQGIFYDIYTLFLAAFHSDVILYLGPGAGYILPFFKPFQQRIIVNHGGLNEWEREKYSYFQKFIARLGHKYGAKSARINIADNFLLKDSIKNEFGVDSTVIRYGGDHAIKVYPNDKLLNKYPFLSEDYYVNVSRAQVDNNLHLVLDAFTNLPDKKLVMVSNWSVSAYGIDLKRKFSNRYSNIILLDAVYDTEEINAIRGNAKAYIHSHSYCGTSPSLVEAMCLGLPVLSFDVPANRETTKGKARFFCNSTELGNLIKELDYLEFSNVGNEMKRIAHKEYTWATISSQYASLFHQCMN